MTLEDGRKLESRVPSRRDEAHLFRRGPDAPIWKAHPSDFAQATQVLESHGLYPVQPKLTTILGGARFLDVAVGNRVLGRDWSGLIT